MKLNQLSGVPGSRKKRVRAGRGLGSGKGETAGRGIKGHKSRSGAAINGYEGGQMPLHMRMPKRGFNAYRPKRFNIVNLARIQEAADAGKLDPAAPVTEDVLKAAGLIRRKLNGVRILGKHGLKQAFRFEVAGASASARAAIKETGGAIGEDSPPPGPQGGSTPKAPDSAAGDASSPATADAPPPATADAPRKDQDSGADQGKES